MSEGKEILSKSWIKESTEMIQNQHCYLFTYVGYEKKRVFIHIVK
ncbi:hypothetical protein ABH955_000608 [Bacillus sp. RC240]|uniref:Uncharacterized protein n=1 Tax=Bacillus mycoides TaxID=1405 RepID=A0A654BLK8_BACMY|nr:hypothetical protein BACI71_70565 [Bacillus mycoides]